MKTCLAAFLLLFSLGAAANDSSFYSEGDHLIPLDAPDVAIRKEKLVMTRLANDWMLIQVDFVFHSPSAGVRKLGFVTPPTETHSIEGFKTEVNGQAVPSEIRWLEYTHTGKDEIGLVEGDDFQPLCWRNDTDPYSKVLVYRFDAPFRKGLNTVHHSYLYYGRIGSYGRQYDYVITTIQNWKNKQVDEFELVLDMGENSYFLLPGSFWSDGRRIPWRLEGKGKLKNFGDKGYFYQLAVDDCRGYGRFENGVNDTRVKLVDGIVRFRARNFSPEGDINISFPNEYNIAGCGDPEVERRIAKNCPYALKGKIFSDPLLADYFSKGGFSWYVPVKKDVSLDEPDQTRDEADYSQEIKTWLRDDLSRYPPETLRYIKNAPYARRGFTFSDKTLTDYFSKHYPWYVPHGRFDLGNVKLTEDEKALLQKIADIEKSRE